MRHQLFPSHGHFSIFAKTRILNPKGQLIQAAHLKVKKVMLCYDMRYEIQMGNISTPPLEIREDFPILRSNHPFSEFTCFAEWSICAFIDPRASLIRMGCIASHRQKQGRPWNWSSSGLKSNSPADHAPFESSWSSHSWPMKVAAHRRTVIHLAIWCSQHSKPQSFFLSLFYFFYDDRW